MLLQNHTFARTRPVDDARRVTRVQCYLSNSTFVRHPRRSCFLEISWRILFEWRSLAFYLQWFCRSCLLAVRFRELSTFMLCCLKLKVHESVFNSVHATCNLCRGNILIRAKLYSTYLYILYIQIICLILIQTKAANRSFLFIRPARLQHVFFYE